MTPLRALLAVACAAALAGCSGSDDDAASQGSVTASGSGDEQTVTLQMTDELVFAPSQVRAAVGRLALTVENAGRVPHDLAFVDPSLGRTELVKGKRSATLVVALSRAGTYRFRCTIHSGMDGEVVVR